MRPSDPRTALGNLRRSIAGRMQDDVSQSSHHGIVTRKRAASDGTANPSKKPNIGESHDSHVLSDTLQSAATNSAQAHTQHEPLSDEDVEDLSDVDFYGDSLLSTPH